MTSMRNVISCLFGNISVYSPSWFGTILHCNILYHFGHFFFKRNGTIIVQWPYYASMQVGRTLYSTMLNSATQVFSVLQHASQYTEILATATTYTNNGYGYRLAKKISNRLFKYWTIILANLVICHWNQRHHFLYSSNLRRQLTNLDDTLWNREHPTLHSPSLVRSHTKFLPMPWPSADNPQPFIPFM